MVHTNDDVIDYIEKLALISFTNEERIKLVKELEKIIEMFNTVNTVEGLEKWEPLYHVHDISLPLRDDSESEEVDFEKTMLKDNAVLINGYVKAPKTIT
ncbi:MAG: Asp-tRNA(Asn)/Glu-tRNA(Gln) amidotransferase subunit GatC [Ignisphaera sp.]